MEIEKLIAEYRKRRPEIRARLDQFSSLHTAADKTIFQELCFCILTANANAKYCDIAIQELGRTGLLFKGTASQIRPKLKGRVRFHNKKAEFILHARKLFTCGSKIGVRNKLNFSDIFRLREWLVENIRGYGYKEASHFLRNIGLGKDISILDRHILKNLKKYGVIDKVPVSVGSKKVYLAIEEKMRQFSRKVRIPLDEMDLLFWSIQTGFVFK